MVGAEIRECALEIRLCYNVSKRIILVKRCWNHVPSKVAKGDCDGLGGLNYTRLMEARDEEVEGEMQGCVKTWQNKATPLIASL